MSAHRPRMHGGDRAPKRHRPLQTGWRDGDWKCSRSGCGGINFASRAKCRDCGAAKPSAGSSPPQPAKRGDWTCSCTFNNFASRTTCRLCAKARPPQPPSSTSAPEQRLGDWPCSCSFMNFGSRTACYSCGKARESTTTTETDEEASQDNECVVCMDAPRNALIATCRHLSMCTVCIQSVDKCPICRAEFTASNIIPIFIA